MKKILSILAILFTAFIFSCKKPAGSGGNSTVTGKVHATNYNAAFTVVHNEYMAPDQDVYIIYGDDATYGEKTKTSPDGVFEFKYLRPGSYRVYVYSKDKPEYLAEIAAGNLTPNPPEIAVYQDVEITKKKQEVDTGILEIVK